jgi:hypothetical protein
MAALPLIRVVARLTQAISKTIVHPRYFPYPLTPTLHATRISIAYRANVRKTGSQLSYGADLAGFLLMVGPRPLRSSMRKREKSGSGCLGEQVERMAPGGLLTQRRLLTSWIRFHPVVPLA